MGTSAAYEAPIGINHQHQEPVMIDQTLKSAGPRPDLRTLSAAELDAVAGGAAAPKSKGPIIIIEFPIPRTPRVVM